MDSKTSKKKISLRVFIASSIGTILEWYDFTLFAFLTPILANLFFPNQNQFTALMLTYAIFAIGFLARPIGAALFGHFGDSIGRKKTLIVSILLMAIPTFLIGLLPTYHEIGMAAPLLLIILRLCQGLSAGGESTGATLFVMETTSYRHRGLIGALLWAVVGIGMILGSFAAMMVTEYAQYTWAWRVPFILGLFTGLIGYFVRKRTPESVLFEQVLEKGILAQYPLFKGVVEYKIELLRIMGIYVLSAMITYLIYVFMPTYVANVSHLSLQTTTLVSTIALAVNTCLIPLGGYLSDLVGRKTCFRWSAFGLLLLSYPLFHLIADGSLEHLIMAECIFVLLGMVFQGTINAAVIEQVPTAVRYSVVAVSYNISYSLFGGTAPLVASNIVKFTGDKASPGLYLMFGALIALLATYKMRETYQLPLT
jgi:MHS family proline/betaine transporter-like MFS transporter